MANIRVNGKVPYEIRHFFIDKLKFNDNSNNEYSDCYYVSTLMSCLAESLVSTDGRQTDEFTLGDADEEEIRWRDMQFQKMAIHEIERYRRIYEWIPSFQNVYSVTSLDCIARLMSTKAIARKGSDFLQYTQPGNCDEVRLKAFEIVARLGMLSSQSMLAYCISSLATDPSPYFRQQLWEHTWSGIGVGLFSEQPSEAGAPPSSNGGLVVEQATTDDRQELAKRIDSIEGALEALKKELAGYQALPAALIDALSSDIKGVVDLVELLDICEIIYEPEDRLVLSPKYPRYWQMEHTGRGKLTFSRSNHSRVKPYNWNAFSFTSTVPKPGAAATSAQSSKDKPQLLRLKTHIQRSTSPDLKRRRESLAVDEIAQPPSKIRFTQKPRQSSQTPPPPQQQTPVQPPAPVSAQPSRRPSLIVTASPAPPIHSPATASPAPPARAPTAKPSPQPHIHVKKKSLLFFFS